MHHMHHMHHMHMLCASCAQHARVAFTATELEALMMKMHGPVPASIRKALSTKNKEQPALWTEKTVMHLLTCIRLYPGTSAQAIEYVERTGSADGLLAYLRGFAKPRPERPIGYNNAVFEELAEYLDQLEREDNLRRGVEAAREAAARRRMARRNNS